MSESTAIQVLEDIVIKDGDSNTPNNNSQSQPPVTDTAQTADPISPAHAVRASDFTMISDDEDAKVILNLETVPIDARDPLEDDSDHETEILQVSTGSDISELARMQLSQLASNKKYRKKKDSGGGSGTVKADTSPGSSKDNSPKIDEQSQKNIFRKINRVDIKEGTDGEITIRPNIPEAKSKSRPDNEIDLQKNDDLIAILEGDGGDDEGDTGDTGSKADSGDELEVIPVSENGEPMDEETAIMLQKEKEKELAKQSIELLAAKNRKRAKPGAENISKSTHLINSLVSDWSDNEKSPDIKSQNEKTPLAKQPRIKKENDSKQSTPIPAPVSPFKRSRIIKKKVIWDPDAPETQFSYASLVQSSAKKIPPKKVTVPSSIDTPPVKKIYPKTPIKTKDDQQEQKPKVMIPIKRRPETPMPSTPSNKKKKVSEVDKLLNDEGASNMLKSVNMDKSVAKDTRQKKEAPAGASSVAAGIVKRDQLPKKRPIKSPASASWDYVYNQQNVDSLIIRRRSNSSYSSTSPRRLSLDAVAPQSSSKAGGGSQSRGKAFEFAKPNVKKVNKMSNIRMPAHSIVGDISSDIKESIRRSHRVPLNFDGKELQVKLSDIQPKNVTQDKKLNEIFIKRIENVVQIMINQKTDKLKNSFKPELMDEIVTQLESLQNDNSCRVVYMTSIGQNFCLGIDFMPLIANTADKRKQAANEISSSLTKFLKTLASFPKLLVAGVNGSCSGIGTTMLTLFDIVVASDKSFFETPCAKIGHIPEGNCLLSLNSNIRHNFKTKLLLLSEKLTSTEAGLAGLVSKIVLSSKVQDEGLACAKKLSSSSQQALLAIKSQKQKTELNTLLAALDEEKKLLVQHWQTAECQEKFKSYLIHGHW